MYDIKEKFLFLFVIRKATLITIIIVNNVISNPYLSRKCDLRIVMSTGRGETPTERSKWRLHQIFTLTDTNHAIGVIYHGTW